MPTILPSRNEGAGPAGNFELWVDAEGAGKGTAEYLGAIAGGGEHWLEYDLRPDKSTVVGAASSMGLSCYFHGPFTGVKAYVDPRYSYSLQPGLYGNERSLGNLLPPGSPIPIGPKIVQSRIEESNEDNNQIVVKKADIKVEKP